MLLNRNELDKREILNEIVNDFPFVRKQRRLVEECDQPVKLSQSVAASRSVT